MFEIIKKVLNFLDNTVGHTLISLWVDSKLELIFFVILLGTFLILWQIKLYHLILLFLFIETIIYFMFLQIYKK